MDTNVVLGLVLALTGAADLVLARVLPKLPAAAKAVLTWAGVAFLLLGALLALRIIRII